MSEDKLDRQIADIGTRYLNRTFGELAQLREYLDQAQNGDAGAMKPLGQLAHRIHGSGAMFGFEALSARADAIEQLAAAGGRETDVIERLRAGISALEEEVTRQIQQRKIE